MKTKQMLALILFSALFAAAITAQNADFSQKTVAVFEPQFKNGSKDDSWIPAFVQGLVASNITNYSDMSVIDRQRIDEVLREQMLSENETYSERTRIEVGNLLAAQYIVFVSIIKKGSGYSIEYKITNTATGLMAASHVNANCTSADMEDGSAVNGDCRELLLKIGVEEERLSDLSKENIRRQRAEVLANEQIAKGMAAERSGNIVEAISFYQKALGNGAGVAEAASRMKSTTSNMISGGVGANVAQVARNEIAQLNRETDQWIKVFTDFLDLYRNANVIQVFYHEKLPEPKREFGSMTIEYEGIEIGLCINLEEINAVYETIKEAFDSIEEKRLDWYLNKSTNAKRLKELIPSPSSSAWRNLYNSASFEISLFNTNNKNIASYKGELGIVFRPPSNDVGDATQRFFVGLKRNVARNTPLDEASRILGEKDLLPFWLCANSGSFIWAKSGKPFWLNDYPGLIDYEYGCKLARLETETVSIALDLSISVDDYTEPLTLKIEMHNGTCQSYEQIDQDARYSSAEKVRAALTENGGEFTSEMFCNFYPDFYAIKDFAIPHGVKTIGKFAFNGCRSLVSVTIPNGVTEIGDFAFSICSSLSSMTIPKSVKAIGKYAFNSCSSLASISIPNGVTEIGDSAFNSCSSLADISIPESVTKINASMFYNCKSLANVTIPKSVTEIGALAFDGCSSLASVTIPQSVTTIGGGAFRNCSSLVSVTIPKSVTKIGGEIFRDCSSLASVTVLAETPPSIYGKVKNSFPQDTIIYVPSDSVEVYQKSWKKYKNNIQAIQK